MENSRDSFSTSAHKHQHRVNESGTALTVLDICTGAGGEALGLEMAGFDNAAAVEIDGNACQTLRLNRPAWNVIESDIRAINGNDFKGVLKMSPALPRQNSHPTATTYYENCLTSIM